MRTVSVFATALLALAWAESPATSAEHTVKLIDGLGDHHHPIATEHAEAQKFFDQGLILTFAFNHAEAIQAFEKAHELDPKSPMPLWGKALALGPNYNLNIDPVSEKLAFDTITEAAALAADAPEREKAYVAAMEVRYSGDANPDLNQLALNYAKAMGELSARYPDDLDAATLYAEARMNLKPWLLWTLDHQPAEGTLEIVADLESVLARDPDHPGANHLYIHAVEASAHPEWAIPAAEKLEMISKAAGHLVHMPSHIYMLIGDYRAAAEQNEIASDVDHSYIEQDQVKGVYPMLYYHHNLHFVAAASGMLGRYAPAKDAAERLLKSVTMHASDIAEMQGFVLEYFGPYPLLTAVRFNDWDAVLAFPAPDESLPLSSGFHHYARGAALVAKGDMAGAEEARTALAKIRDTLPEGILYGYSAGTDVLGIALSVLDGRIATAKGDRKAAIGHFEAAVGIQDRLAYNEPADWYYPVRETLGAALFLDGQHAAAEEVFRDDLKKSRRSGRALFGLWKSLEAQGKGEDAGLVRARYEKEWEGAEITLALEFVLRSGVPYACRLKLLSRLLLIIGAAWFCAAPGYALADNEVDMELVLAVDVSASMDREEFLVQRGGYVEAIRHPDVLRAIHAGRHRRIALAYVEWSAQTWQKITVPWQVIQDEASAAAFAATLEAQPLEIGRGTSISAAIGFASALLESNSYESNRRVIDISGDGPNNFGGPVAAARDDAVADGVILNGLPILIKPSPLVPDVAVYYIDCVIGGPGAFALPVRRIEEFAEAIRRKLIMEIADRVGARIIPVAATAPVDCLAGEKMRERFADPYYPGLDN